MRPEEPLLTALLVLLVVVLLAVVALLWMRLEGRSGRPTNPCEPAPPAPPCEPEPPEPPRAIPDRVSAAELPSFLAPTMAGVEIGTGAAVEARAVVWVEGTDEVVAHLDSLTVAFEDGIVLVAIDLECDETGRATVVVPFAVGHEETSLLLVTEEEPRGPEVLVRRWGPAVREAAFAALAALVERHGEERGQLPAGLAAGGGHLRLEAR